ncbi:hypothetical protein ANCCAN_09441 [Ancylostoma caninum]|uniref:Uncharacterized protein n=1 Tax=Ancylostoma caninum TaxID=29170 RepID=A0A368GJI9_ANCCA|nr:hypothetical protein ANCCAN_09441 [Ancylostoma caninum]
MPKVTVMSPNYRTRQVTSTLAPCTLGGSRSFRFFNISLTADEPAVCHPYLSEVSTLQFRCTEDLQYIELAVIEECRRDEGLMNDLKLTKYGLLVMNTKSRLMDKQRSFFTKTFADFNNLKWPESKEDYHAFFVLDSQPGGDTTVPPGKGCQS